MPLALGKGYVVGMASRILLTALLTTTLYGQHLLVLSKSDTTLSIVDPATLKVLARVPSGPDPHEVEAATDGKLAYISNYGGGAYKRHPSPSSIWKGGRCCSTRWISAPCAGPTG